MSEIDELRPVPVLPEPGSRRRRRPRVGLLAAAVLSVVVAIIVPLAVVKRVHDSPAPAEPAPEQLDPAIGRLAFGWLPGGDALRQWTTSTQGETLISKGGLTAVIRPADAPPVGVEDRAEAAAPVGGAPAWWWCADANGKPRPGPCTTLLWQWAPDGWATMSGSGDRATVHRVAEGLRTGGTAARRYPYALTRVPELYRLDTYTTWTDGRTQLRLATPSSGTRPVQLTTGSPGSATAPRPSRPNATAAGYPVRVDAAAGEVTLQATDFHGVYVVLSSPEPDGAPYGGGVGVLTLLTTMRVVADPSDPTLWTARLFG